MTKGFQITYLQAGEVIGTRIIDSLDGEVADKALSGFGIMFPPGISPDDFYITEGTYVPHPTKCGAVVFKAD